MIASTERIVAVRRFGLGARPGELKAMTRPRQYVEDQMDPKAALLTGDTYPTSAQIYREIWEFQEGERKAREAKAMEPASPPQQAATAPKPPAALRPPQRYYQADVTERLAIQVATDTPFVERLVNFWSNHFCVSAEKNDHVRGGAGAYEREAIRPFVLGRFSDMLSAVAHHPNMLMYLDNQVSFGPNSKGGLREKKGLNENLGREIMELHSLGVDGGYTQADVTSFARALTGWTIAYRNDTIVEPGRFRFIADRHEPGPVTIMGTTFDAPDQRQAEAALDMFAHHPSTARHIARKLARHFIGDDASPELIGRLAETFTATRGDLMAVSRQLVSAEEAWTAPPAKIMAPWDVLVALGRALGLSWAYPEANRFLALFGQPTWQVPFPAGWPDDDNAWAAPDSLLEMLDAASAFAKRNAGDRDIAMLAREVLGPSLSTETATAIGRCEARDQALALLIMSPEFLRR